MPRDVRNFWFDAEVDGRSSIGTGPRSSDGGMYLSFYVRNTRQVERSIRVEGYVGLDKKLHFVVRDPTGNTVYESITER